MALPRAAQVRVLSADGERMTLPVGRRLTFGRGNMADLFVPGGRDLSRHAGEIVALAGGAWIENLSRSHALYVRGEAYHVRLPPSGEDGPSGGWLVCRGTVVVGSMAMIRQDLSLRVDVTTGTNGAKSVTVPGGHGTDGDESTHRPLALRPDTKLYLVALLLCRPWLLDPSHAMSLPTAPQIARSALECASASRQLELLDASPGFRASLVGQVNDLMKYLRERVQANGLAPAGARLTPAVIAQALLVNDVITIADLACLDRPEWRSLQEELWWKADS